MAEQLEFYFPKTKSKHMAMPTQGKVYPSKGGTVRYGVQASMNGSMSLPKYVKEEEFNSFGFGKVHSSGKIASKNHGLHGGNRVDEIYTQPSEDTFRKNPDYIYPQEFLDAFYDYDSNPTADTQDDETVAIAYQAWYQKQAENEVLNAEVNVGEKRVMSRKDYDIDNELSGFSNMEIDVNLEDYEDEITESVEDEVIEAIRESVDDNMPISDGDSVASNVYVDTELEITVPISGDIDYDWTANETHEEERDDDEWNAEEPEVFGGSNYAVKMIKNAQNHLKMVREAESFEAPYGGIGSLFGIGGDTELGGFSTSELTGSSAIHGDFDSASLNYSGHQNLQVRAEDSPSPSSPLEEVPATVPSPAEPTNESFNAEKVENDLDYIRKLTDSFMSKNPTIIGEYGPFGYYKLYEHPVRGDTDFLYFYTPAMGGLLVQSALHHKDQMNDKDAAIVSNNLVKLLKQDNLYHTDFFGDENQLNTDGLYEGTQDVYFAEMDELSEDTSIIRNRVGDMVGMVELDENDEDIEKVDIDIIDDDGKMAYEGTLGAEGSPYDRVLHEKGDYRIVAEEDYDALMSYKNGMEEDEYQKLYEQTDTYGMFYIQVQKKVMGGWETIDSLSGVVPSDTISLEDLVLTEMEIPEGVDFGAETFESQGTNTKMILGITALAVGLGLWKGKEIMSISEKITESIKNMRK